MFQDSIAQAASNYGIRPLKKYGQNFIFDSSLCDKIVRASRISSGLNILEIGPGVGGLTRAILKTNPSNFTVVEADKRFIPLLEEVKSKYNNLNIIFTNALDFNLTSLQQKNINIIANLPYNIGTSLLIRWLTESWLISSITVMLQKEVVDRIKAIPGTKAYGRLSVICQLICNVEKCFDVGAAAFYPAPKVSSTVIRLTPRQDRPTARIIQTVELITAAAFSQRRKIIKSSLKELKLEAILTNLNIPPMARAENIRPAQYLALAVALDKMSH